MDNETMELLEQRLRGASVRLARRLCSRAYEPGDLYQEMLLKIIQVELRDPVHLKEKVEAKGIGYLIKVGVNAAKDFVRAEAKHGGCESLEDRYDTINVAQEGTDINFAELTVQTLLSELLPTEKGRGALRRVVAMASEGASVADMAEQLGQSRTNIYKLLHLLRHVPDIAA